MKKVSKKIKIVCMECRNSVYRYRNAGRPQLFCSRPCFLKSNYHKGIQREKMVDRSLRLEKNPTWKGEKVSYKGIHKWIKDNFGVAKLHNCEICQGKSGSKTMNWANLDGKYSRERKTWAILCKKCHANFDWMRRKKITEFTEYQKMLKRSRHDIINNIE